MPKKGTKKDKFAALPPEFVDAITSMAPEQIRIRIAEVAMENELLKVQQKEDEQLKEARIAAKEANRQYAEGFKMNSLKIQRAKLALEDKGQVTPT